MKAEYLKQQELERIAYKTILFRKVIKLRIATARKRLESVLIIQRWYRDAREAKAERSTGSTTRT